MCVMFVFVVLFVLVVAAVGDLADEFSKEVLRGGSSASFVGLISHCCLTWSNAPRGLPPVHSNCNGVSSVPSYKQCGGTLALAAGDCLLFRLKLN